MARRMVPRAWWVLITLLGACSSGGSGTTGNRTSDASDRSVSSAGSVVVTLRFVDPVDDATGDRAVDVLRRRFDSLGLARPDVTRAGQRVSVRLTGTSAPDPQTLALLTKSSSLEFRPECASLPPSLPASTYAQAVDPAFGGTCVGLGGAPAAFTTCAQPEDGAAPPPNDQVIVAPEDSDRDGTTDSCLVLGPASLTGSAVKGAQAAQPQGAYVIELTLTDESLAAFNVLSGSCFNRDTRCPDGRTAIVLDGVVLSAPAPQTPTFTSTQIQISGKFSQRDAEELAALLGAGALPARLTVESVQSLQSS